MPEPPSEPLCPQCGTVMLANLGRSIRIKLARLWWACPNCLHATQPCPVPEALLAGRKIGEALR